MQPGPREVRIKVKYNGICGSDLEAYRGSRKPEFMSCPMRLGHEVSGIIDVVGSSVVGLVPGQKVATRYVWGALAGELQRPRSPVVPRALSRGPRRLASVSPLYVVSGFPYPIPAGDRLRVHRLHAVQRQGAA